MKFRRKTKQKRTWESSVVQALKDYVKEMRLLEHGIDSIREKRNSNKRK